MRALPVLLGGLKHNQVPVRKAAPEALAILGRMVEKAVPHVRPLIGGDPDAVVRAAAITALARIVPWARRTQDYLTRVGLRDEAEEVRLRGSSSASAYCTSTQAEAARTLARVAAQDESFAVRRKATEMLARLGKGSRWRSRS